jgi:hypothetical protein
VISADLVDNPPKIGLLPVAFLLRSDLSNFEIAIDSVDNTLQSLVLSLVVLFVTRWALTVVGTIPISVYSISLILSVLSY